AYVGYSADGGATLHKTNITGGTDGGCSGSSGTDFSVIAIDTQGNLYLVYACQNGTNPWRVYFSHTTGFTSVNVTMDNLATRAVNVASGWTVPVPITGPGTSAAGAINYAVFPWITAGDAGRIDVANTMFAAFPGGPFDMVARQVGGPSLYTAVGSLNGTTPADTNVVADPTGDGQYPTSDTSVNSLDLLQASATLKDNATLEVGF